MTDDTAKRAREEAERLLPCTCIGGHFPKCQQQQTAAVAAYIEGLMRDRQHWAELMGEQARRRIDESNARVAAEQQLADAQREIERLKAAAWATLTIADMTVPQIVAMKQENAALRRALAEENEACAKIAESYCDAPGQYVGAGCDAEDIAAEIRARASLEQK